MSGTKGCFLLVVMLWGVAGVPIVLKESSPNGEAVIAISSSNPAVEKYFLDYATARSSREQTSPVVINRSGNHGTLVQSFSIATPEKTIVGTGRSFSDASPNNPFYTPLFASPSFEDFDIRNWLRNIERFYDVHEPSFTGSGSSVSATAIKDNGRVYGKVETAKL